MIPRNSLVLIYTSIWNLYINLKSNITGIKRGNNISLKINFIFDSFLSLAFSHPFIRSIVNSRTSSYPNRPGYCFLMHPVWSRDLWEPSEKDGYKLSTCECPVLRVGPGERKIRSFYLEKKKWSSTLHTRRPDSFKFSFTHVFNFDKMQFTSRLHRLARVSFDYVSYHCPLIVV